jgi:Zn-dependent peptidase ImmA (M78 family)
MPTPAQIERKSWRLLQEHRLETAPVDVHRLAEELDLDLSFEPMEDDVSAMLLIEDGEGHIVVNKSHHANRQRFSIAHEIGHFLLHAKGDQLFVDRSFYRNQASSVGESRQEVEANAFAASLLMPSKLVKEDLPDDDDPELYVARLASTYAVSELAMTYRLVKLRYIDA